MMHLTDFFISLPPESLLYAGNYDLVLVGLSIVVAIFASYASLLVSQHVTVTSAKTARRIWISFGGLSLGAGIWSMHFVGMLSFNLPCSSSYDPSITFLSILPSVVSCILAIKIISCREISRARLIYGGLLIGAGIGAMHYAGMAAMRLNGIIRYDAALFFLSIVVAISLATLALWIKFRLQQWQSRWNIWASATVMGMAVSGMHYTAMAAAYFIRDGGADVLTPGVAPALLATVVMVATSLIIVATIVATYAEKNPLSAFGKSYRLIGLLFIGWIGISWLSADYYFRHLESNFYKQELQLANQQVEDIAYDIDKNIKLLKGISSMLSRDADTHLALRKFGGKQEASTAPYELRKRLWQQDKILRKLSDTLQIAASNLEADNIFVLNAAGDCIGSGNAGTPGSPVGSNFVDRTYFAKVREGQQGSQYALGKTTRIPGLYYAHPVLEKGLFLGAVVVKRDIAGFAYWLKQANSFISDANGVIVLARDKQLEFRSLPDTDSVRYSSEKIKTLYLRSSLEPLKVMHWQKNYPEAKRVGASNSPKIWVERRLPEDGITLHVTRSLEEIARFNTEKYWLFMLLATAGGMLVIASSAVVIHLRESQRRADDLRVAATAFESQEGMLITDADSVILRVNRAFESITGYSDKEVIGQTPRFLSSGRHDKHFYAAMWQCIHETGAWEGEVWNRRKNGEIFPEYLTITAVKGADACVVNYVATFNDITANKLAEEKIRNLAFYDPLTRLPNRRLLKDRLQQALAAKARSGRWGALLFIDLDNFKVINDSAGHAFGDLLLQQVAQRLSSCLREQDTVARLGGDEFLVMLEELSVDELESAAQTELVGEKIRASLNQPYQLYALQYLSTASIGATLFNEKSASIDELMKQADIAMYQVKKEGGNALRFFDPQMQSAITSRIALESELRQGIANEQLFLCYQAVVSATGIISGAEVLVRWQHPQRGIIYPADFIQLAEETGLIMPLGFWVLYTACAQLAIWATHTETEHLTLAVNVSARQFQQDDFVASVLAVIESTGANPQRLKLELTESMLVSDVDRIIAKMKALKERGVGFSLDDFGTGYSSLSYLSRLPLDQLKIDRSFVMGLEFDESAVVICAATISLAHNLKLKVVAEGVENEAQSYFLGSVHHCDYLQGYLYSRPVPLCDFEALLKCTARRL